MARTPETVMGLIASLLGIIIGLVIAYDNLSNPELVIAFIVPSVLGIWASLNLKLNKRIKLSSVIFIMASFVPVIISGFDVGAILFVWSVPGILFLISGVIGLVRPGNKGPSK